MYIILFRDREGYTFLMYVNEITCAKRLRDILNNRVLVKLVYCVMECTICNLVSCTFGCFRPACVYKYQWHTFLY